VKDVFIPAKEAFKSVTLWTTLTKEVFTRAFVDEMDAFSIDKDAFKVVIKDSDAWVTVDAKEVFTTWVKASNRIPRSEMFDVFTVTLSFKAVN
jgi:hypothetical protein